MDLTDREFAAMDYSRAGLPAQAAAPSYPAFLCDLSREVDDVSKFSSTRTTCLFDGRRLSNADLRTAFASHITLRAALLTAKQFVVMDGTTWRCGAPLVVDPAQPTAVLCTLEHDEEWARHDVLLNAHLAVFRSMLKRPNGVRVVWRGKSVISYREQPGLATGAFTVAFMPPLPGQPEASWPRTILWDFLDAARNPGAVQ